MSQNKDDDYWNSPDVRAFNFDEEDLTSTSNIVNANSNYAISTTSTTAQISGIKTLGSILAAKVSSNEPFLKPSMIMCEGNRIEELIEHLETCYLDVDQLTEKVRQDPKTYISDIVNKKASIDMSPYKSKREKLLLLDCAICCSDGNVITAAAIFMSKTLKQSIFIEEMKTRPIAIDHYMNYLEMTGRSREAAEFRKKISSTDSFQYWLEFRSPCIVINLHNFFLKTLSLPSPVIVISSSPNSAVKVWPNVIPKCRTFVLVQFISLIAISLI